MVTCNKLVQVPENEGGGIIIINNTITIGGELSFILLIITRNRKLIFINFKEDDQTLTTGLPD